MLSRQPLGFPNRSELRGQAWMINESLRDHM